MLIFSLPIEPPIGERSSPPKVGTLRYKDRKARAAAAVDAGNFPGSRHAAKNKMLKTCIFAKDGDVNNLNFVQAHRSNYIL